MQYTVCGLCSLSWSIQTYLSQTIVKRDYGFSVRCNGLLSARRQHPELCREVFGLERGAVVVDPEWPRLPKFITTHLTEEDVTESLKFDGLEKCKS